MTKYVCLLISSFLLVNIVLAAPHQISKDSEHQKFSNSKAAARESLTIGLAGDVMLGRLVNKTIAKTSYAYPWGNMLSTLRRTDLNLINLETTLTQSKKKVTKVFNFRAEPDRVKSLLAAKIDVCNLANNHILDFSQQGLIETLAVLDKASIRHVGAGINASVAKKPVILTKRNITVGILGYTDNEPGWAAGKNKAGTNYVRIGGSFTKVEKQIKALRKKVDIVIVTIHWGPNMRKVPTPAFQDFAHKVIDAGADIFQGHSAHIFQGIEVYKNKLILYDTGDFVDDYYVTPSLRNDQSFFYIVTVNKQRLQRVQLVPVLISHMQVNKAKKPDYKEMVKRLKTLSKPFGTKIKETEKGVFVQLK